MGQLREQDVDNIDAVRIARLEGDGRLSVLVKKATRLETNIP
jgi:Predicted membrane protein